MKDEAAHILERNRMVDDQLIWRGIHDPRVLEAMRSVPRHSFVPDEYLDMAYQDCPLPIGSGQTISQPYIVALMSESLALKGSEKVLEVGTGSGYQAAILAKLAGEVHTIERHTSLAEQARRVLESLGYDNVCIHVGDGSKGLPEHAPYQAIIVTASAPKVPRPLLEQLDEGGRLILPVGDRWGGQTLQLWERHGDKYDHEAILAVAFVPLRGEYGWKED
jgi:protein-L-isoaspartate(D-aspartate) O-methyltransferase